MHDPVELVIVFEDSFEEEIIIDPDIALQICNLAVDQWTSPGALINDAFRKLITESDN